MTELVIEKSDLQDEEVMKQLCVHLMKSKCKKLRLSFCKLPYLSSLIRVTKDSGMTDLNLSFNISSEVEVDFVDQLVNSGVSHLSLQGCEIPLRYSRKLLAQALPAMKSLVYLDLSYSLKDDKEALQLIFKNIPLISLRELFLNGNGIDDYDFVELCQDELCSKLELISFSFNNITDLGLNLLGCALFDSRVHTLDLSFNKICGRNSSHEKLPPNLTNLNLGGNKIEDVKMFSCLRHSSITELNLMCTFIGDEAGQKLIQCLPTNLCRLNISQNGLALGTAQELANFLKKSSLTVVNISDNGLPPEAFSIIGKSVNDSKVQEISLGGGFQNILDGSNVSTFINVIEGSALFKLIVNYVDLQEEKAGKLATSLEKSNLTHLDLSSWIIDGEGIAILASCLKQTKITHLYLSGNKISDEDAKKLAAGIKESKVLYLDLEKNNLTFEGACILTRTMVYFRLHTLILKKNNFSDKAIEKLAQLIKGTFITLLDVSNNKGKRLPMIAVLSENRSRFSGLLHFFQKIKPVNGIKFCFDSFNGVEDCVKQSLNFYKKVAEEPSAFNALVEEVIWESWESLHELIISKFPQQLGIFTQNQTEELEKHIKFVQLAEELNLSTFAEIFLKNLAVKIIEGKEEILNPTAHKLLLNYKDSLCKLKMDFEHKDKVLQYFYKLRPCSISL